MRTMLQATNLPRLQSCEEIVLGRRMACNSIFERGNSGAPISDSPVLLDVDAALLGRARLEVA
jgi:hypothetical protein